MFYRRAGALLGAVVLLSVGGCSSGATPQGAGTASSTPPGSTPAASGSPAGGGLPRPDHVMVVIFENKDAQKVVGAAEAPYLTSLAAQGANFTDAHGEVHPSQANYLALFSGSTQGVHGDSCPHTFHAPNLASQLAAAGHTFTGYSESLPSPGFQGCSDGDYARKHNPWVNFSNLPASINQPHSALPSDFTKLPTVSFVVPNLCNDMHDCDVATGDRWAKANLAQYVSWARTHNSLLAVTFDEDNNTAANRIATFLVGPMVRPGPTSQRIDHYGLLRTIEDMYGLSPLGEAAKTQPVTGIWAG